MSVGTRFLMACAAAVVTVAISSAVGSLRTLPEDVPKALQLDVDREKTTAYNMEALKKAGDKIKPKKCLV